MFVTWHTMVGRFIGVVLVLKEEADMEKDTVKLASIICPECYDVLQATENKFYQCSMGHKYTLQELIAEQNKKIEEFLWTVNRLIDERTDMLMLLVQQEPALSNLFEQQAINPRTAASITCELMQICK